MFSRPRSLTGRDSGTLRPPSFPPSHRGTGDAHALYAIYGALSAFGALFTWIGVTSFEKSVVTDDSTLERATTHRRFRPARPELICRYISGRGITMRSDFPDNSASADGCIPFRLRIGVIGHRDIDRTDQIRAAIDETIDGIVETVRDYSVGGVRLTIVSSLARGADQIVAESVLRRKEADLEAILPFELKQYRAGLGADAEAGFDELVARARWVKTMPGAITHEDGYELAGHAVVDRSDVLIALWDGGPGGGKGGTAETVEYARLLNERRPSFPILVIDPRAPSCARLTPADVRLLKSPSLEEANAYNAHRLGHRAMLDQRAGPGVQQLLVGDRYALAGDDLAETDPARPLVQWIAPYYVRADSLAGRAHRRYVRFGWTIVVASAVALVCAAIRAIFEPHPAWPSVVEVIALLVLALGVAAGRRLGVIGAWITSRFLAERLRSAVFLAAAGLDERRDSAAGGDAPDEENDWVRRAYAEVWLQRPHVDVPFEEVRTLVADGWVDGQTRYHQRSAEAHHRKQRIAIASIWVLLLAAVCVAVTHLFAEESVAEDTFTSTRLLSLMSIVLPALGGAVTAVVAQRDYERHHRRHARIERDLARLRDRLRVASDSAELKVMVGRAEQMMIAETRDWYGSVQFHDFEPHV